MKLFYAMLGTETNTFSPIPTGLNVWRATTLRRTSELDQATVTRGQRVFQPLFRQLDAHGWTMAPGLQAFASPGGITPARVWHQLRDELLADLAAAMPVSGVLLFLHGAMVAEGCDDCEGDLLRRVRELVGPDVPVGAELDLHCHLTPAMLSHADVLVGYKEYPHVDTYDRLLELFDLLQRSHAGEIRPVMASFDCRMVGMYHTIREPMRGFVDAMTAAQQRPGILNVWLAHGFPYGDVPGMGAQVLVVADRDQALAAATAREFGEQFFALREQVQSQPASLAQCLQEAAALAAAGQHPITVADTGDNTGGGAPGDSTFALDELLRQQFGRAALGPLYDPLAVSICQDAGLGAQLNLRVGGKLCRDSGAPLDLSCTVIGLAERVSQTLNAGPSQLGPAAGIRVHGRSGVAPLFAAGEGIEVMLCSRRIQAGSPELFTGVGIQPEQQHCLVVKSTQHFHAGFAPLSHKVLYAGDKGALQGNFLDIPYQRLDRSTRWPFAADPFQ